MSDKLVGLIYDAAIKPERWPELLESLAQSLERNQRLSEKKLIPVRRENNNILSDVKEIASEDGDSNLMHHFGQALLIAEKINKISEQRDALISLIDRLPSAIFLISADGKINVSNQLAKELLKCQHGILSVNGTLMCEYHNDTKKLHELIRDLSTPKAILSVSRGIAIRSKSAKEPIINCSLVPLRQSSFAEYGLSDISVAVFINIDIDKQSLHTNALKDVYGLTARENKILERLALGYTTNEIAEHFFISVHTVRNHVKHIFDKTKKHSQGELIGMVLSNPASSMSEPNTLFEETDQLFDFSASLAMPESMECERIKLSDSRFLAYKEYGDRKGIPVIFCHSAKGSRFQVPPIDEYLIRNRIRLIAPDRPGFGLSDPQPGRTVSKWSDDLRELVDKLGIKKFYISGYSTGGMYALATAQKHPDRVKGVLVLSGGVNPTSNELFEGMLPVHKMVFYLACNAPSIYQVFSKLMARGILHDPESYIRKMSTTLCDKDLETFAEPEIKKSYMKSSFECGRQGAAESMNDILFSVCKPDFDYKDIIVPTHIWHGELDQNLPLHLAQTLHSELPNSKLRVVHGHGHMMFYGVLGDALSALINES